MMKLHIQAFYHARLTLILKDALEFHFHMNPLTTYDTIIFGQSIFLWFLVVMVMTQNKATRLFLTKLLVLFDKKSDPAFKTCGFQNDPFLTF